MKITRIEARPVVMRLTEAYTIAYETVNCAANVFLRMDTDEGVIGWGCAAPDLPVTGETVDTVMRCVDELIRPAVLGADALRRAAVLEALKREMPNQPAALAAVDMALFDVLGKKCGLPIWKLLGGFRECIPTSVTVGILPVEETLAAARAWRQRGFRCLKIKGGRDVETDIVRVLTLRQALGPDVELRFDANQGYTVEQALHFVDATRAAEIETLEQPTPKSDPELLGRVTRAVSVPVMADESLMTLRDAFRLARNDFVDMVNIKLMKVGGIGEAQHINSVARAAGVETMVSCMDESGLAIAAGLHLALALPNVLYADLDGHLGLLGDPAQEAVIIRDGTLYPTEKPGLGFDLTW